jgi:hypothetical protein
MMLLHMAWRRTLMGCTLLVSLLGCARGPATAPVGDSTGVLSLALPASALGCRLAVQQQLTVQPPGQNAQTLDALLEVDELHVRLALFHLGQRMGLLDWDGQQLHTELSRWWPQQLPPQQVISDMQLALWPAAAIARALPQGWVLEEIDSGRRYSLKGLERILVQAESADALLIRYAPAVWQLHVATPGGMRPCAAQQEAR